MNFKNSQKYIQSIDTLRAFSVLAVIFYHAKLEINNIEIFTGGFLGVDVFFVISGFLITKIILKEVDQNTFSLKNFYLRRIKRIVPLLILVIIICIPISIFLLLPKNLIDFSNSSVFALLFSSNFYFLFDGMNYGEKNGLLKPLLHTWTLGVEEQFYLFYPIFLIFILNFFKRYFFFFISLIFFLSFICAQFLNLKFPDYNFFFSLSRIWELLAGGLISQIKIKNNLILKFLSNQIFQYILICVLILFFLFLSEPLNHPSLNTLPIIFLTSILLIISNSNINQIRILNIKFFSNIGLISYSLYLWHYPIFAFYRVYTNKVNVLEILFLIFLIFLISIISYKFFEKKFRYEFNNKIVFIFLTISILLIFSFNLIVKKTSGLDFRVPEILKNQKLIDRPLYGNYDNHHLYGNYINSKTVFLIGDSHMFRLSRDLKNRLDEKKINYLQSIVPGCVFLVESQVVHKKSLKTQKCNLEIQSKRLEEINRTKNNIVIIGGRYTLLIEEKSYNNGYGGIENPFNFYIQNKLKNLNTKKERISFIEDNFKKTIHKLIKNNHEIILIYPIPEMGWNIPEKIFSNAPKNLFLKKQIKSYIEELDFSIKYSDYINRNKETIRIFDLINNDKIHRIYPEKIFCNKKLDKCYGHKNQKILYEDNNHPSLYSSTLINNKILKMINNFSN